MNSAEFWGDLAALGDASESGEYGRLVSTLAQTSEEVIIGCSEKLVELLYGLDRRVFAEVPAEGQVARDGAPVFLEADGFLYARCAVCRRGSLSLRIRDSGFLRISPIYSLSAAKAEELLEIASAAFLQLIGREWDHVDEFDYETGSNEAAWAR